MAEQLSKAYEPKTTEKLANEIWFSQPYFHAEASADGGKGGQKPYTIVIPPPNVTAPLHLGHALNNTLQDVLIRFRRMQNYSTLWMPGTDHAGIATQTVVEKRILSEEGKRRTDFEREEFVGRVQAWKDEYEARIIEQLRAMGCSCDWDRTRFTMDQVCAKAVRAAFFKLFKDGLIYRGKRLVNWDPATQTVLADDEVEHETVKGHFWYLRYPLVESVEIDGKRIEHVTVATTRPETMLGDTAVAMNPTDPRAGALLGKKVRLPIVGRIIPIIADEHVVLPNPESEDEKAKFSTGFLKVTPAHDPDDWEIGQRHDLDIVNVMAPDGSISDKYGWEDATAPEAQSLLGMDRFEAREAIVEWFRQEDLLEDVREYVHEVGHSYRSHVPIEPYLSDQWYIAVKKPIYHLSDKFSQGLIEGTDVPVNSLAGLALKPLLNGRLRFIPERYAKTYQAWLENLRDWPISRQLWWGHRIPVWMKDFKIPGEGELEGPLGLEDLGEEVWEKVCRSLQNQEGTGIIATEEWANFQVPHPSKDGWIRVYRCIRDEGLEHKMESIGWEREEDVLDTWFSSALWPFSTMGWPDDTPELKTFYPGNVLCTAREIITLWVSRMVMMGQYCVGDIPFSDVYIHAMIQDGEGRKMSKSLGNGIDPLVAINSHGADAMRFTLASMTTDTQDVRMPVQKMKLPDGRQENTSPKFDSGRNFCNKLWNASRFALMNLEGIDPDKFDKDRMTITDRWILSRLNYTIEEVTKSLGNYKFHEPIGLSARFFWNEFCDWYLEWAKPRMQDEQQKPIAQNVLAFVLDQVLRLLHPFIPFITEGIFQKLNEVVPVRKLQGLIEINESDALAIAQWPEQLDFVDEEYNKEDVSITNVQRVIRDVRNIRNEYNIPPSRKLKVSVNVSAPGAESVAKDLNENKELIIQLAGLAETEIAIDITKPKNAAAAIHEDMQVYVHDVIDVEAERKRLQKKKQQVEKAKKATEAKLANKDFVNKAKPEVVEKAREKLAELSGQLDVVEKHLAELES
ncbi:MAG: valine--tRNA ligase [Phycisphaerae bacterium]|nr:valine--tRNA ligase [Phycisphaerae bacterium]NIP54451.1 valine--tRNA ligase [Phycisphaerae bacterium]NIS53310.1 valine--tRNA ligase [Phycisphaerae bacterium]NIU10836.1 valine--tRNA ligase [Phycisphaerae bacterium]NIU58631.1 valine--tRNA ligase [Phycisphaerae bacterium]